MGTFDLCTNMQAECRCGRLDNGAKFRKESECNQCQDLFYLFADWWYVVRESRIECPFPTVRRGIKISTGCVCVKSGCPSKENERWMLASPRGQGDEIQASLPPKFDLLINSTFPELSIRPCEKKIKIRLVGSSQNLSMIIRIPCWVASSPCVDQR